MIKKKHGNVPAFFDIIVAPDHQSSIQPRASSSSPSSLPSLLKHTTSDSLNCDRKTRHLLNTLAHKKLAANIRREMIDGTKNTKVIHSFGAWK